MSELLLRRRNLLIRKQEEELNIRAVCFKADGEQTVSITKNGTAPDITMQYSYDGVNWDAWDLSALPFGGRTKVYIRGRNTGFASSSSKYNMFTFGTDSYVYVSGIAEALLDGENEVLQYSAKYTFKSLFKNQTALREANRLRFEAMTISDSCYETMFQDCANLLTAPEIPATKITGAPFVQMFGYCSSLVKGPSILPATTITSMAYKQMFYKCTSLVNAPELPAETLMPFCYEAMFQGCTSLKSIRCHAKEPASNSIASWVDGVKTAGTFYGHSEFGWGTLDGGIPSGWTFVELTD